MTRLLARARTQVAPDVDADSHERGVTLVLAAAVLVVLMGMAGFAVDLGWLFLKTTETQKAAEAAALAGVVHMPNNGGMPWGPGAEAWDTAVDVAARNGFTASVTPNEVVGKPNQLNVSIDNTVPTFFMKVFGINQVSFTRDATAEQLPPLKIGSDEPYLGTDPTTPGRNRYFFVSVNGEQELKENGDPYSTRCTTGCPNNSNSQFRDPAYYYAVDVPFGGGGPALTVELYDPSHWAGNRNDLVINGNVLATGDRVNEPIDITFRLHAPDTTPNNPGDNVPIGGCTQTFTDEGAPPAPGVQEWVPLCTVGSVPGIYVLTVSVDGDRRGITDFAVRARYGGSLASSVAVYGLGSMSIDMNEGSVAPNFKIVKLEEIYAGTQLIVSLFDPGDVTGGAANLTFVGELASTECQYRVLDQAGAEIRPWGKDDSPGIAPCFLNTTGQRFNNEWVEFRWDVPDTYTCASDCWVNVDYDFPAGSQPNERTTWAARINGQPIHLLP